MTFRILPFFLIVFAASSCKKSSDGPATQSCGTCGPTLSEHISLAVDSACLTTGNVFTPNWDGINDILYITAINVTDVEVELRQLNGSMIYSGDNTGLYEFNLPAPPAGEPPLRLILKLTGTSLSGHLLEGYTMIHTVTVPQDQCFAGNIAPVTPDQFITPDGSQATCEPSSISYDQFCVL
jgi:hypothetical protein